MRISLAENQEITKFSAVCLASTQGYRHGRGREIRQPVWDTPSRRADAAKPSISKNELKPIVFRMEFPRESVAV